MTKNMAEIISHVLMHYCVKHDRTVRERQGLSLYFIPHNIAKTKEKPILEPHKCIDTLIPIKKAALMSHFLFFHYFKEYATEHTEAIYQISQNFLLDLSNKLLSYIL